MTLTYEASSNKSQEWYTPRRIFDALGIEFDLDPCSPGNDIVPWIPARKCYMLKDDGLTLPWRGNVWMNPPYSTTGTPRWMARLSEHGTGIALVFVRTDTRWFHDCVPSADAICFIRGRIAFVPQDKAVDYAAGKWEPKLSTGAASMLVAYGEINAKTLRECGLGFTVMCEDAK